MALESASASRSWLWLALLLTLGLVYWQASQEPAANATVEAVNTPHVRPLAASDTTPARTAVTRPGVMGEATSATRAPTPLPAHAYFTRQLPAEKPSHALFAAHEWLPPPPKPQPPPPPEVPAVPYAYVGSLQDMPDGDAVILMQQKKVLVQKIGSALNAQWRLDREDTQMVYFTYLPLNKKVGLSKTKPAAVARSTDADNNFQEEMQNQ